MALADQSRESVGYMLHHCANYTDRLSKWENDFLDSVTDQFERGWTLKQKQIDKLEEIYCKLP